MFNARLAGDHLYRKWFFTWLSLVMSLMMSDFVLSIFPRDVLDEIWDWIEKIGRKTFRNWLNSVPDPVQDIPESVLENFPT